MISIIIPNYNSEKTIKHCLDAIFSSNNKQFEVILVDNGSTDKCLDIVLQYKVQTKKLEKNYGAAYARNYGTKFAKYDILLFIDSDIIIKPDTLTKLILLFKYNYIEVMSGLTSSYSHYKNITSVYKTARLNYRHYNTPEYVTTTHGSFTAIYKHVFDYIKGYPVTKTNAVEDLDFGLELAKRGIKCYMSKDIVVDHYKYYTLWKFLKNDLNRTALFKKSLNKYKDVPDIDIMVDNSMKLNVILSYLILLFIWSWKIETVLLLLYTVNNSTLFKYIYKNTNLKTLIYGYFVNIIDGIMIGLGYIYGILI